MKRHTTTRTTPCPLCGETVHLAECPNPDAEAQRKAGLALFRYWSQTEPADEDYSLPPGRARVTMGDVVLFLRWLAYRLTPGRNE